VGVAFFVPWLWFTIRGGLRGRWALRAFVAFVLGGLQGLLGWYMVKSGLVDMPSVSHYRLTAHLGLAFLVGMYVLWLILDLRTKSDAAVPNASVRRWTRAFLVLLIVQIIYGAFMAGTRAGYLYQTFPDMNGMYVPTGWLRMEPIWMNLVANHDAIHFIHRTLGWLVGIGGCALAVYAYRQSASDGQRAVAGLLGGGVAAQFLLGVFTVVFGVPTVMGAAHQLGAYLLLSVVIIQVHGHRSPAA
jgi:cytochrome c oxidase assembly protein subunit 15